MCGCVKLFAVPGKTYLMPWPGYFIYNISNSNVQVRECSRQVLASNHTMPEVFVFFVDAIQGV